ncbi:GtrA family protein [Nitrobacteraceae bacterium UC4446_H13]
MRRLIPRLIRIWSSSATRLKIASFALIGVGNTLIDLGVFTLAYKLFELPVITANVIAWLVAVSGSYIMNTFITFHAETGKVLRFKHYASFIASGALGMIATTTALVVLALYVHVMAAKLASVLVGFAINFTMSNLVVFRAPKPKA